MLIMLALFVVFQNFLDKMIALKFQLITQTLPYILYYDCYN